MILRAAVLLFCWVPAFGAELSGRVGLYQWLGANPDGRDLLTAARERTAELGLQVFRFYLGARYDYQRPYLSPGRFDAELEGPPTPAAILASPRYRAVLEDRRLRTVILTVYCSRDYGAGYDDINLNRPWSEADRIAVSTQLSKLVRSLFERYADRDLTVILANNEADEKLMEILNYTGDARLAIGNLRQWCNARQAAVESVRREFPDARLEVWHAFEISIVQLRIAAARGRFLKSARGSGWSALEDVIPKIRADLISYSAYESANSPWRTGNADTPPAQTDARLRRDLDQIRERARLSISNAGRRRFGDNFVMIGELGFARELFEPLPSGGVLPRVFYALRSARDWGCPYVVLWQVFDAPRFGDAPWGFGAFDKHHREPLLRAPAGACASLAACLKTVAARGLDSWPTTAAESSETTFEAVKESAQ